MSHQPEVVLVQPLPLARHQQIQRPPLGKSPGCKFSGIKDSGCQFNWLKKPLEKPLEISYYVVGREAIEGLHFLASLPRAVAGHEKTQPFNWIHSRLFTFALSSAVMKKEQNN